LCFFLFYLILVDSECNDFILLEVLKRYVDFDEYTKSLWSTRNCSNELNYERSCYLVILGYSPDWKYSYTVGEVEELANTCFIYFDELIKKQIQISVNPYNVYLLGVRGLFYNIYYY